MASQTPFHNLGKFEQNEDNWSHNDTVDAVEDELPKSGPLADRPVDPPVGRRYYSTDVRVLEQYDPDHAYSDASGWFPIAGLGTLSDPVPATAHFSDITLGGDPVATEAYADAAYGDADAVAAVEAEDPLDLPGDLNVVGTVDGVDVSAHASDAAAHHTKYTDAEAVAAVEAETPLDLAGDLNVTGGVGVGMNAATAPLEVQGNADTSFGIVLHTLNDAGTTAEERAGILFADDAGNNLGNLTAHTHSTGHHLSLYGYDGTHTGFKAFDVESNGDFNFGPDISRVQVQSPLRVDTTELGAFTLNRTDANSVKFNMVEQDGQSVEFRLVNDALRIIGDDGNQMVQMTTGGPFRVWDTIDLRGDLELNQNFLYFEDFNAAGSEYEMFANNGNLITRAPDGSNVLLVADTGDVTVPGGGLFVQGGGPNGTGEVQFGQGSRIYEDANGELVAEDSAGNPTTLT